MSRVMVHLACLLLLVAPWAVPGARMNTKLQGAAKSNENHTSLVDKFAVSDSHIKDLCTDEAVQEACAVLGSSPHPAAQASTEQLAMILVAEEAEAIALVHDLGISLNGTSFTCRSFCEAAVRRIPNVLHVAAPKTQNVGCIDDACGEDVDLSADALIKDGLSSPPTRENDYERTLPDKAHAQDIDPEVRKQMLFRTTLNVILSIFPSADDIDDLSGTSLLEWPGNNKVKFGPNIYSQRHDKYKKFLLKASAWIATALRKLRSGRKTVRKWFILRNEREVDLQTKTARRHLTRMLQLSNHVMLKKGGSSDCPVRKTAGGASGTLAFVMTYVGCTVDSKNDCGTKTPDDRYIVNICEFYWNQGFEDSVRIGTLVHESSHHFGTDDKGYCSAINCLRLSPADAKNNADTYTELVKELVETPYQETDLNHAVWTTTVEYDGHGYGGQGVHVTDTSYVRAYKFLFIGALCFICAACAFCVFKHYNSTDRTPVRGKGKGKGQGTAKKAEPKTATGKKPAPKAAVKGKGKGKGQSNCNVS